MSKVLCDSLETAKARFVRNALNCSAITVRLPSVMATASSLRLHDLTDHRYRCFIFDFVSERILLLNCSNACALQQEYTQPDHEAHPIIVIGNRPDGTIGKPFPAPAESAPVDADDNATTISQMNKYYFDRLF